MFEYLMVKELRPWFNGPWKLKAKFRGQTLTVFYDYSKGPLHNQKQACEALAAHMGLPTDGWKPAGSFLFQGQAFINVKHRLLTAPDLVQ